MVASDQPQPQSQPCPDECCCSGPRARKAFPCPRAHLAQTPAPCPGLSGSGACTRPRALQAPGCTVLSGCPWAELHWAQHIAAQPAPTWARSQGFPSPFPSQQPAPMHPPALFLSSPSRAPALAVQPPLREPAGAVLQRLQQPLRAGSWLQVPTGLLPQLAAPSCLQPLPCLWPSPRPGCCTAGQVRKHASILPRLPLPMPPVNMSLSDGKVNKFSSRLKVSIISFVSNK